MCRLRVLVLLLGVLAPASLRAQTGTVPLDSATRATLAAWLVPGARVRLVQGRNVLPQPVHVVALRGDTLVTSPWASGARPQSVVLADVRRLDVREGTRGHAVVGGTMAVVTVAPVVVGMVLLVALLDSGTSTGTLYTMGALGLGGALALGASAGNAVRTPAWRTVYPAPPR